MATTKALWDNPATHFERTLRILRSNPKKWLLAAVPIALEKLIEHRVLTWANDRLDHEASPMIARIRDLAQTSIAHPWWTVFVILAAYAICMVMMAHFSGWHKIARTYQGGEPGTEENPKPRGESPEARSSFEIDRQTLEALQALLPSGDIAQLRLRHFWGDFRWEFDNVLVGFRQMGTSSRTPLS